MKLYNTPAKKIEYFIPQNGKQVRLYTCGPTVYNNPHIGNWVAYIRWDTLVRALTIVGYDVNRVMNITDVGHLVSDGDEGEDKILKGSLREGITMREVADRYTAAFMNGMEQLNLLPPTTVAKATDYIDQQIALVKKLEDKGFIYVISDGVYFDTAKFPRYADFAHLDLKGMEAGARVEFNKQKRSTSDFALWKFDVNNERTEMVWDSPWGKGFPGWHIECSAMAMELLGETLDIHTGGIDHIPVHHTNEIAQSEAATGKPFSLFWLHNNHILVNGVKISKSLNNGYTLDDLAKKGHSPLVYKLLILQSHYRTQSNFSWENLQDAANRLSNWQAIADLQWQTNDTLQQDIEKSTNATTADIYAAIKKIKDALSDDLNTPGALMHIEALFNRLESVPLLAIQRRSLLEVLTLIDDSLGLQLVESSKDITDDQKRLVLERQRARENKDWKTSDKLRDALLKASIGIRDTSNGPVWFKN